MITQQHPEQIGQPYNSNYDDIIIEEKSKQDQTHYDIENFNEQMEDETGADLEDEEKHNELILANLNIMKDNPIPEKYHIKAHHMASPEQREEIRIMMKLPQTQEELDELSIDSADY